MANPFDQFDEKQSVNPFDKFDAPKSEKSTIGWSDVPLSALKNVPSSAGNFLSGIAKAVAHPIDTAGNLYDAAAGGVQNYAKLAIENENAKRLARGKTPVDSIVSRAVMGEPTEKMQKANAIGQFMGDRYGSAEGVKNTLATDPVGAAADLSMLLTGGASLASKAPQLAKASSALNTAAKYTNPINAITKPVAYLAPKVGGVTADLIGGLGTRTGGESIKQAFRSGREGGESAKILADNMRGNVLMTDVLDTAKANLQVMGASKSAAYREGMARVSRDKSVLDFSNIDKAVSDAANVATFKGQIKNARAAEVQSKIADTVAEWKRLDPKEFHTPEGLDALKQKIGGIVESIPFEEKTAGMVGRNIYNSVKSEIAKQAPVYADTMKGYSEASDQIREIERALSLGNKASTDTAMRKLQSLTRNNVNTNFGNRLDLARKLEEQGGKQIMPALAGQSLSTITPRGLGGAVAGGLGLGGYAVGGAGLAIPMLATQSPRLMGEAALASGKAAGAIQKGAEYGGGLLGKVGMSSEELANYLYQAGRLPQQ